MSNRRLLFVTILSSIALLPLYLTMFRSFPDLADAPSVTPWMMGGTAGSREGTQGTMYQLSRNNVPIGVNARTHYASEACHAPTNAGVRTCRALWP